MKKRNLVRIVVFLIIILSFSYVCLNYFKNGSFKKIYQNRLITQQFIADEVEMKHKNIKYALMSLANEEMKECNNSFEINEIKLKKHMKDIFDLFQLNGNIYFVSDVGKIIISSESKTFDVENVSEYDWYKENIDYYGIKMVAVEENYLKEKRMTFLYPIFNNNERYLGTVVFEYDVNEYKDILDKYNIDTAPFDMKIEFTNGNVIFVTNTDEREDKVINRYRLEDNIVLELSYVKNRILKFAKYVILIFNVINAIVIIQIVYLTLIKNRLDKFKRLCHLFMILIILELLIFNFEEIQDELYHCKKDGFNFKNYVETANEQENVYCDILGETIDEDMNKMLLNATNADNTKNILELKKKLDFNSCFVIKNVSNNYLCDMYPNFSNEIKEKILNENFELTTDDSEYDFNIMKVDYNGKNDNEYLIYKKWFDDNKECIVGFYVVRENPILHFCENNIKNIDECSIKYGKIKNDSEVYFYNEKNELELFANDESKKNKANYIKDETILFRCNIKNHKKYILKFAKKNSESEIIALDLDYLYNNNFTELFLMVIICTIFLVVKFSIDFFEKNDKVVDYDVEIKNDIQNMKEKDV